MSHRFELKKFMRQNQEELEFLECQGGLRLGKCTKKTEEFITSLERPLPEDLKEEAIHIFFLRECHPKSLIEDDSTVLSQMNTGMKLQTRVIQRTFLAQLSITCD